MHSRRFLVAAVSTGLLIAGCGANDQGPGAQPAARDLKPGGTLPILTHPSTFPFDPAKSQGLAITSNGLVHRRLTTWKVAEGQTTTVVPDLATDTGKPSTDG